MLKLRDGGVIWKEVDGETLLLDLATSTYIAVNESGAVLWRLLAEGASTEALAGALTSTFDISSEEATADVDEFVADCRARGYIEDVTA
jgi:hypothetical protein